VSAVLFAGIYVSDYPSARDWYIRLLDAEPSFHPTDTEAVWELAEGRWLYIQPSPEHAGHAVVTIFPDDLDAAVAAAAVHGIEPTEWERYPGDVRKAVFRDADGNQIGLAGGPPL
jgi:catechol 2,3-dioxygenase-like lactoylglutathione lyase family enzyme